MATRIRSVWTVVIVTALSLPMVAFAEDRCTCPDMLDLANRRGEAIAAIAAYQAQLSAWSAGGAIPDASESVRASLQASVQSALSKLKDYRANDGSAVTDSSCTTKVTAPTSCLEEVIQQHEQVHRNACNEYAASHHIGPGVFSSLDRWSSLAEYAREEIAGYEAELVYVNANLTNLERDCRFTLEFTSQIVGTTEATMSDANTKVDLQVFFPRGYTPKGLTGSKRLEYKTRDVGPPKVIGDPMLAKLVPACYAASEGKGEVSFEVRDGWIMRENVAPYAPLVELPIYVGKTEERYRTKGPRGCPHEGPTKVSFWTDRFLEGKRVAAVETESRSGSPSVSGTAVVIDGWDIAPRSGVFAEKKIERSCPVAGMSLTGGPGTHVCERTTLTLRQVGKR